MLVLLQNCVAAWWSFAFALGFLALGPGSAGSVVLLRSWTTRFFGLGLKPLMARLALHAHKRRGCTETEETRRRHCCHHYHHRYIRGAAACSATAAVAARYCCRLAPLSLLSLSLSLSRSLASSDPLAPSCPSLDQIQAVHSSADKAEAAHEKRLR